ncbi:MAG TPA: ATP-binding protein [Brevundimonas sp.]|jgi:two-component system sensor histidine kinase ChvG|uniref:ATP-binding protein n=1 Tax=Brevundimonas sp. TaxID=1871086 RepID=UPI002E118841|nr:ATP-binding protein [Brevundimonas sp.]
MASATDTARAEPGDDGDPVRRPLRLAGSRLGGLILALNLFSLLILLVGALLLNEWRRNLIDARLDSLTAQAELLANLLGEAGATRGEPYPTLNPVDAALLLRDNFIPVGQRARLFDDQGFLVTDSYAVSEEIPGAALPPAAPAGEAPPPPRDREADARELAQARTELEAEVTAALAGEARAGLRLSESGDRVVSVSIPVRHVRQVLGVLTLEAGDVDETVNAQRRALMPFAVVAVLVSLLSSLMMHLFVVRPMTRLSTAADAVRLQRARAISLPDLEGRKDEIGDLARALETMTRTLSDRMDAIERFAADVAHEIKNPLTSIRSALETLPLVKAEAQREKLTALLQADVRRLDRLITDISNASRLDAELSRDRPRPVDLGRLLAEIVNVYVTSARPGEPEVRFGAGALDSALVMGRDGPLGQVFRNLIDNARSFSPPGGVVDVRLEQDGEDPDLPLRVRVSDQGPGVPPDNLETVFERFYTSRPKGTAFGANSGLGLSIARQIVEAHGGRIHAENGAGGGAVFVVRLPAVRPGQPRRLR